MGFAKYILCLLFVTVGLDFLLSLEGPPGSGVLGRQLHPVPSVLRPRALPFWGGNVYVKKTSGGITLLLVSLSLKLLVALEFHSSPSA